MALAPDPAHLYKQNPLLCGTIILQTGVCLDKLGLCLLDRYSSIFLVAHLYNLIRITGLSTTSWPALEKVVDIQMVPLRSKLSEGSTFASGRTSRVSARSV